MAGKGIVWLPVAIGIIFLAQILIFSVMFTKVTVFSREVQDANIIFEGDKMETYVRSIDSSIQLSIAQALYDFYLNNRGVWQSYETKSVPDPQGEVPSNVLKYTDAFVKAHDKFQENEDYKIDFSGVGISKLLLSLKEGKVSATFEEATLKKGFAVTTYERKFVPESTLVTVFGEMMGVIKNDLIGGDLVRDYVIEGIGKPTAGGGKDVCGVPDRLSSEGDKKSGTGRKLNSYIDQHVKFPNQYPPVAPTTETVKAGEVTATVTRAVAKLEEDERFSGLKRDGQTRTTGWLEFCNLDATEYKGCSCDDPCPSPDKDYPAISEPSPEKIYGDYTHGVSYGDAMKYMQDYARERIVCLEAEFDHRSTEYTVAFDGDNKNDGMGPLAVQTEADIASSCNLENLKNLCRGVTKDQCGTCPTPGGGETTKYIWECPVLHRKTCQYNHQAEASVDARFQEDGFVYGFFRPGEGEEKGAVPIPDNIKLVFKIISGNMNAKAQ